MSHKIDLTFIGAIENSKNRFVEKEYLLMIKSLRANGGIYANAPITLVQPTKNNISPRTMIELKKLDVDFIRPKSPLVSETGRGFLNMPVACKYLSEVLETKYMVWLDCDTYIFSEPKLFEISPKDIVSHANMENYDHFFNEEHRNDYLSDVAAQRYLYRLLTGKLEFQHINTWFIQAYTKSNFWRDWYELTMEYVEKIEKNSELITTSEFINFPGQGTEHPILEYAISSTEEVAAGALFHNYNFIEPQGTAHQYLDNDTKICHYDDWSVLTQIYKDHGLKKKLEEIESICR